MDHDSINIACHFLKNSALFQVSLPSKVSNFSWLERKLPMSSHCLGTTIYTGKKPLLSEARMRLQQAPVAEELTDS